MPWNISAKLLQNDDNICDVGWQVGEEVKWDAENSRLILPPGNYMCPYTMGHLLELFMIFSKYVPGWALYDENNEPYLPYRCCSIGTVWWVLKRTKEVKRGLCGLTPEERTTKDEMVKEALTKRGYKYSEPL